MIKMPINFFYRKIWFTAKLTCYFSDIVFCFFVIFYSNASITKILFLLRNFTQSIASKVKACITHVTIKDLIGVRIKTTEAYFAISLKKLFIDWFSCLSRFNHLHIIDELIEHLLSFILCPMLNISQYRVMHESFLNFNYFRIKILHLHLNGILMISN